MKRSLLLVLILNLSILTLKAQQWTKAEDNDYLKFNWYTLGPQEVEGNEIFSATGDHVIYSDNFGANWTPLRYVANQYSGNPELVMKNSHTLLVLGYATVIGGDPSLWAEYRTGNLTDSSQWGGWNTLGSNGNFGYTSGRFRAGEFLDDSLGFIYGEFIGANGTEKVIFETQDGGLSWDSISNPPAETPFHIVDNDTFYYQKVNTRALYLWDGTNETQLIPAAGSSALSVFPFDAQNLVAYRRHFSGNDSIWFSNNAGQTFQKKEVSVIPNGYTTRSVHFIDMNTGGIVVDSFYNDPGTNTPVYKQLIFTTADGGDTWNEKQFNGHDGEFAFGLYVQDTGSLMIIENFGSGSDIFHYGCHIPRSFETVGLNAPLTYDFGGNQIGTSGYYSDTMISSGGCDSVVFLDFTSFVGAWYKFDGTGLDERGRNLDLNVNFGYGQDRFGNASAAAEFFGDPFMPDPSNSIGILDDKAINIKNDFSISAYVNVDFDQSPFLQTIIRTASNPHLFLDDSTLYFDFANQQLSSNQTLSDETWHHVVIQKEDTTLIMYLDQNEVGRLEVDRSEINAMNDSYRWFVGGNRYFDQGSGQYFNLDNLQGSIDDLMIVSKSLSAAERALLFNGQDFATNISSELIQQKANIYPNPSSGLISITTHNSEDKTLKIRDLNGRTLLESSHNTEHISLDLRNFRKGIYFIEILQESNKQVERILIK